jgi:DNA-directed RNA polymerase subunit E'/Rpb7
VIAGLGVGGIAVAFAAQKTLENLEEGKIVEGVVKNITDYGAFVDLGGIDGLMRYYRYVLGRINHPRQTEERQICLQDVGLINRGKRVDLA